MNNNSYSSISPSPMQMPASSMSAFSSLIHPNHLNLSSNHQIRPHALKEPEQSPSKIPSIFTPPQLPILNKSRASSPANTSFNTLYTSKAQSDAAFKTRSITPNSSETNYSKPQSEDNFSNDIESNPKVNHLENGVENKSSKVIIIIYIFILLHLRSNIRKCCCFFLYFFLTKIIFFNEINFHQSTFIWGDYFSI